MPINRTRKADISSSQILILSVFAIGVLVIAWWWSDRQKTSRVIPGSNSVSTHEAGREHRTVPSSTKISVIKSNRKKQNADPLVEQIRSKVDAADDGWVSEVLSDGALSQLDILIHYLKSGVTEDQQLKSLTDDRFTCNSLRPDGVVEAFKDEMVTVRRMIDQEVTSGDDFQGPVGLGKAMSELMDFMRPLEHPYAKFKIVTVDVKELVFTTDVYVEISNRNENESFQITSTWVCEWSVPTNHSELPSLRSIKTSTYEDVTSKAPQGSLFVDCTQAALEKNESYRQHVLTGFDHWVTNISRLEMMRYMGLHGVSVADVNGDGLEDVYMCEVGGLPNRLFVQDTDGTFTDRSRESGIDWLEYTTSALFVDLDNDGDQDVVLATRPFLLIAENLGSGRFQKVYGKQVVTDAYNVGAADFDNDRDLDLYVCGYLPDEVGTLASPVPYYDANNGGMNTLLRNEGSFQFEDVTESVGLNQNNTRFSYAAVWEDFNDDGHLDIYVANDFGRNNLYLWRDGQFVDVAEAAGVQDTASGMSVCTGDYNGDGTMDIYVGNMFSSAGNRIAFQPQFSEIRADLPVKDLQRMARGNTLYANNGDGTFRDTSVEAGVNMGRWSWGSKFTDLNNDGWLDLMVTNGFITAAETGDL